MELNVFKHEICLNQWVKETIKFHQSPLESVRNQLILKTDN